MDTKEYGWKIEKRVVFRGWQRADCMAGTFEQAINQANEILTQDENVFQVRLAQLHHPIECGYYIPQWLEGE